MKANKTSLALIALLLVLSAFLLVGGRAFSTSAAAGYAQTSAKAICVMEAGSGRVLYQKNSAQKLAMASTTKIMTAITAIENCDDLDKKFEISPKAVGVPGTSLYLRRGEIFSTRDLLYGLMLISGNDASVAIGEHVGGSIDNFLKMMNELAQKIGASDTHFDNTHGLDSKTHYTTARDLALIASYAMQNDIFRQIVSTKNTTITSAQGQTRYLKNKNKLLSKLQGCDGVKTGFTDDAGRCLVSSCERDGMRLVCVVLNCGPMFEESQALLQQGFEQFRLYDLSKFFTFPTDLKIEDSKQDTIKIGTREGIYYPLRLSELEKIKLVYNLQNYITAPAQKGQKVGQISIFLDKDLLFCENIVTMEDVRSNTVWEGIKTITSNW